MKPKRKLRPYRKFKCIDIALLWPELIQKRLYALAYDRKVRAAMLGWTQGETQSA